MNITKQKGTGITIYTPITEEGRKQCNRMIVNPPRSLYIGSLRPQGNPMSVRRQMRGATAGGLAKHVTPNNRALTPDRSKITQRVEVKNVKIKDYFPDGSRTYSYASFNPVRFKVITHARSGWIR